MRRLRKEAARQRSLRRERLFKIWRCKQTNIALQKHKAEMTNTPTQLQTHPRQPQTLWLLTQPASKTFLECFLFFKQKYFCVTTADTHNSSTLKQGNKKREKKERFPFENVQCCLLKGPEAGSLCLPFFVSPDKLDSIGDKVPS